MKKSHGPELNKRRIALALCEACKGKAVVRPLIYELPCDSCNASGWVEASTGDALPLEELVIQLSFMLQAARRQLKEALNPRPIGAEATYQGSNRRGAGGTNYTGD
ncbi:TPA: hypothetical protein QEM76_004078 [Pseudomonas putida]|nr:hypothetical protein [Pseudomonas putida]HDS1807334.1 hypothetical protein [Pseudomonas putida]